MGNYLILNLLRNTLQFTIYLLLTTLQFNDKIMLQREGLTKD